jgi:adenylate cyclase
MRVTIGIKIFGIAVALLIVMGAAALLSLRMTRTIDAQLVVVDQNYFPAFVALAEANIDTLRESALFHRELLARDPHAEPGAENLAELGRRLAEAVKGSDDSLAAARKSINEQITDDLDFDDSVALARLDTHVEFLQQARQKYESLVGRIRAAYQTGQIDAAERLLRDLDDLRDDFDRRMDAARRAMRDIAGNAILGTRAYQQRVVEISLALLVLAGLLGLTVAAAVTMGLVRPVRRLLAGTTAVERGALDTVVPVTSRDEIGSLTRSFNAMVGELRAKAQIRETFGKYVDPRIVAGLIDRPELTDPKGARREMTILFCDMQGFTGFSEGMTPPTLVAVLNRYLTVVSDTIHRNSGIIDKYIGDGVMAFWGQPFTPAEDQGRLAALTAIEMLAALPGFQAELPDLIGVRRGLPEVRMRVGIATGEVVVGNIGSELTRNYTVIGDTVNLASRLEGACKAYGIATLINAATAALIGDAIETREIDRLLVVGKHEPERVFEILGRSGEVGADKLRLRDAFAGALAAYRAQAWDEARAGFEECQRIVPDDPPSRAFLARVAHFAETPPPADWDGVWTLTAK